MADPVTNFAIATLASGIAQGATSLAVGSGEGAKFPNPATDGAFNLPLWNATDYPSANDDPNKEIVRCTARTGDTFTIVRAQEGTSDVAHNTGGKTYKIALTLTKKTYDDLVTGEQVVTSSASVALAVNKVYSLTGGSLQTCTLPTTAKVGDFIVLQGVGAGLWKLAQNASQIVHFSGLDTTTGTGGYISSNQANDNLILRCVVANNEWEVVSANGGSYDVN